MINFDDVVKEKIKKNIIQIGHKGSGSRKTNSLFNLINQQPDIDKIYLYAKDPNETISIFN